MQKHILDRPARRATSTLDKAVKIEMQDGPHRTTVALQRRPRDGDKSERMRQFVRIAREDAK